jgi:hypothetical protein
MLLSTRISPYLCLPPPPVVSEHFSIEAFRWRIADRALLRGTTKLLRVGWLPHQPSRAFVDVWTSVFDMALGIVIPSHILKSVEFPLPKSLIIWDGCHKLLDAITVFKASEMQSSVFFYQPVVIVRLHSHLVNPRLGTFQLFTCHKQGVGIVL